MVLLFLIEGVFLTEAIHRLSYSGFKQLVRENKVESLVLTQDEIRGRLKEPLEVKGRTTRLFTTVRVDDPELVHLLDQHHVQYSGRVESQWLATLLSWVVPILLFFGVWMFLYRRMGAGSSVMTLGRSRAKIYGENDVKVTFSDVAGVQEAKDELIEVVEFLRRPEKFQRLGGRIPKGVLLVGPPGTGKTLLARAVAGEAKVPFFSISGSEFVEMIVGVGASRVRDLFAQAEAMAPCIGKARGATPLVGGHDEREQTLNQLLVEMDGFDSRKGVCILAATNRPEILDPALLRPGRFDRQVLVDRPDLHGREEILRLHAQKVRLSPSVDLRTIAARTPGFVGADLANVINEAALLAARQDKDAIDMADLEEAIERIIAGLEKKNRILSKREQKIVAYHEAGHALVAASLSNADPVHRISIIPRGIAALGYTLQLPTEDRYLVTRAELLDKLAVLFGGRAAEELIFQEISTGGHNDLQKAADIARRMVMEYGMSSKFGPLAFETKRSPMFLDGTAAGAKEYSEETARDIDEEVARITRETYARVQELLAKRRDDLERLARRLLETEVLEGEELKQLLYGAAPAQPPSVSAATV
ncbi:MAG: ATP-dependent zinc metalloprotease FtsH [candidate division KSB1 bacterium]|nr:ATP-dependent zinc metalloprotease FtsH [candidate division KSB1 bacterium]